jgi:hypothetical protein
LSEPKYLYQNGSPSAQPITLWYGKKVPHRGVRKSAPILRLFQGHSKGVWDIKSYWTLIFTEQ